MFVLGEFAFTFITCMRGEEREEEQNVLYAFVPLFAMACYSNLCRGKMAKEPERKNAFLVCFPCFLVLYELTLETSHLDPH